MAKKAESADKGKKQEREELDVTVGSVFEDKGVTWFVKDGQVCEGCMKSGEKCFWRDSPQATACRHCNLNKKMCEVGAGKEGSEAGPSKKRKVAAKGKGKEKEKLELESGLGVDAGALLEEMRGMREEMEGLRAEFRSLADIGKAVVRLLKMANRNVEFIADQMDSGSDVEDGAGGVESGVGGEKTVGVEVAEDVAEETLQ